MDCDVAIIGAGPVGLMLANLLGRRGHSVRLFEKQASLYPLPRAIHLDGETMRIFQATGLADEILPHTHIGKGMLFQDGNGHTLVDWSRDQSIGAMGWFESYRFYQPGLEAALENGLRRYDHVTLSKGVDVDRLEDTVNGVNVMLPAGPMSARFVVGCDGAQSMTRGALGAGLVDLGFNERWLVVDLRLTRPRPDLGDHTIQYCDPESPATYGRGVGDWRRWEVRLLAQDPDQLDTNQIWAKLARWITPADANLQRGAVYTFRSRISECWSRGRISLAGDAAHQMPPFMGQGMAAGIRDAANLSWKLSAVLSGANASLLDSYQSEREANVRAFIETSVALGQLINQSDPDKIAKGRMRSIWPDLGPGLGVRDGVGGRLVPQFGAKGARGDDSAKGGFQVIGAAESDHEVARERAGDWLAKRSISGIVVRPDGYALGAFRTEEERVALLTMAQQIAPAPFQ